jgi:hypothetical protein
VGMKGILTLDKWKSEAVSRWCHSGELSSLNFVEVTGFVWCTSTSGSFSSGDDGVPCPLHPVGRGRGAMKQCSGERARVLARWSGEKVSGGQQSSFYRGSVRHSHKKGDRRIQSRAQSRLRSFPN